tara:strand:+ start:139 stop:321 length:183 start_codon:yes stop_codon:yes gene_type:complete
MNKNETLEIDRATDSAELDERLAIIKKADSHKDFASYFIGWMWNSDEQLTAAKAFLQWKK